VERERLADRETPQPRRKKFAAVGRETGLPPEAVPLSRAQEEHFAQMTVARARHANLALSGNSLGCDESMKNNASYGNTALPVQA